MRLKREINEDEICKKYSDGAKLLDICSEYRVGKLKVKEILTKNGIVIRGRNCPRIKRNFVINDFRIKKYENTSDFYYVAISKIDGSEYVDCDNDGGHLTSHIREKIGIEIPSLYYRRIYYQTTGNYWWEQWFTVEKRERKLRKKCPYCDWETVDIENKSGAFEMHLREKHNTNKQEYLEYYPEEKDYFKLINKTLNLQMETDMSKYVTCQICGKKLARISTVHLRKHNISRQEYINKYGLNLYSAEYKEKLLNAAAKMNLALDGDNEKFTSKPETDIKNYIEQFGYTCTKNRKILSGKELDIYIKEKNIAIEFNGNKFHTEWFGKKDKRYHLEKTIECQKNNIGLIQIFEDEYYNKKEIVLNKIQHIIGENKNLPKIMGRKCIIKEINNTLSESFLEKNHIQGYVASTIYLGAFYQEKLIAVMTFKREKKDCDSWELTRFASDNKYVCQGVGGKLFKYFIRNYKPQEVKSFADRRWTINEKNNIYIQLGFKFAGYTKPDYKYYNPKIDKYMRIHKFNFRKQKLSKKYGFPMSMTETEMVKELGYDRIWDCGLIKYVWKNNAIGEASKIH